MTHSHLHDLARVAESSVTRIIRRAEIYESDGATLWMPAELTPRLISGSVTVDYDREERRALDCEFDNSDGVLNHDPDGFWYDKIIKVYRGFEFDNPSHQPQIAIVADTSDVLKRFFRRLGFNQITIIPDTQVWDESRANHFDLVAGATWVDADIDRIHSAFLWGVPVLQVGFIGTVDPAFVATKDTQASTLPGLKQFTKPLGDTPIANGWGSFSSSATTEPGVFIRTLTSGSTSVLQTTETGNPVHNSVLYSIPVTNSKWFYYKNLEHLQEATVNPNVVRIFRNAMEWLGVSGELVTYEKQIGEFMIDRINDDHFPTRTKVTGRDYWKKLQKDKFIYSTSFDAGVSLDTVVRAIASNGGITKFALAATGKAIEITTTFDRLTSRGEAIKQLCEAHSIEVFFNAEGYLVTRPMRDPILSPATLTLETGDEGNLVTYNKSANDSHIHNVIVVTGENEEVLAGGVIVSAYVENNEPTSPTRVERIGPRLWDYSSALFQTNEQCHEYATIQLAIRALEEFELNFESIVYPWLEVGDIMVFEDPDPGQDEPSKFLLTSLAIPVALGPMSGTGKRITIVGFAEDRGITVLGIPELSA